MYKQKDFKSNWWKVLKGSHFLNWTKRTLWERAFRRITAFPRKGTLTSFFSIRQTHWLKSTLTQKLIKPNNTCVTYICLCSILTNVYIIYIIYYIFYIYLYTDIYIYIYIYLYIILPYRHIYIYISYMYIYIVYVYIYISYISIYLSIYVSIYLPIHLSVNLFMYLSIYLSI